MSDVLTATPAPTRAPAASGRARFHDLDALRGYAMMLGVVLHAIAMFIPYREIETGDSVALAIVAMIIHGFRMPLFFLLSGFFAAMLLERRGIAGLTKQRLKRVALPFAVALVTVLPATLEALAGGVAFLAALNGEELGPDAFEWIGELGIAHLWFLWDLLLVTALFVGAMALARAVRRAVGSTGTTPRWLLRTALWAIPVLVLVPAGAMAPGELGPETSLELFPPAHILAYYGLFFAWGACAYAFRARGGQPLLTTLGRPIWLWAVLSVITLFVALAAAEDAPGLSEFFEVAFAWSGSLLLVGVFRRWFGKERYGARLVSDASYWVYLTHLPVIVVLQVAFAIVPLPGWIEAALITGLAFAATMLSYMLMVRYTWVGRMLNGRRTRQGDAEIRARAAYVASTSNGAGAPGTR